MKNTSRRVLVLEWLCSGGLLLDGLEPQDLGSLIKQGTTMLTSVCEDLVACGVEVMVPIDFRLNLDIPGQQAMVSDPSQLRRQWVEMVERADDVLVIAPETDGQLKRCLEWFSDCSARSLNPNLTFSQLCSDKNLLQSYFADLGIPVPAGCSVEEWRVTTIYPDGIVVKPADGCGGEDVQFFESVDGPVLSTINPGSRLEEYVPGLPVSVAVLAGCDEVRILPALRQEFDGNPVGHFVRCNDDLSWKAAERAKELAEKVVAVLPRTTGFFGIDMVIGDRDVVIEVNPRITMSYPLLREKLDENLAAKMLENAS